MSNEDTQDILKKLQQHVHEREAQIQRRIRSELNPFREGIRVAPSTSRNFGIFKESFLEFRNKYESKSKLFESILDMESLPSITSKVGELYLLFLYLGRIESVGNTVVDILVMLLVANERDFHIECRHATPRIKHVVSIRDLEEERVPLTTKLNFLRDNGISEVARIMDSELRNDIAHLDFQVKDNEIYVRGKRAGETILESLIDLLAGIGYAAGFLHGMAERISIVAKREIEEKGSA